MNVIGEPLLILTLIIYLHIVTRLLLSNTIWSAIRVGVTAI